MPYRSLAVLFCVSLFAGSAVADAFPDCGGFTDVIQCKDVSPSAASFSGGTQQSPGGRMSALAVAPSDASRLYASGFSGVWRSDDAGVTWRQLTRPQPSGTIVSGSLRVPNVYDLAISPVDKNLVLAATADETLVASATRQGIYRSTDGGESWSRVHAVACSVGSGASPVGQIVFAPDDAARVFAAEGCAIAMSTNGGATWTTSFLPAGGRAWHVAVAPIDGGERRVYAAGDGQLWTSRNGGSTWSKETIVDVPAFFGGYPSEGGGSSAQVLAVEPGNSKRVFLAVPALADGPSFYHPSGLGPDGTTHCNDGGARGCDEGSLWIGDFASTPATWTKLPGPPVYYWVSTPSGNVYVATKPTSSGYLLFFANRTDVHVSDGLPTAHASWHRLGGRDASNGRCAACFGNDENGGQGCNQMSVHVDPHAFAASGDLDFTLAPATCTVGAARVPVPTPYDQNSILDSYSGGTMWMANDGGVYRSTNGGATWTPSLNLSTLQPQASFAGVALAGRAPALYMGVPDNDNFFTLDGGETWRDPFTACGDCGAWFADPAQPNRLLEIDRDPSWSLYANPATDDYADPSDRSQARFNIPLPTGAIVSDGVGFHTTMKGYRPIILTPISEDPVPGGDFIVIRQASPAAPRVLLRTQALSDIAGAGDWDSPLAKQEGPDFLATMKTASVVQASGGHTDPFFFVGDPAGTQQLWRWTSGAPTWQKIVPATDGSAKIARRFFVDPYNPSRIYIIDENAIKRSEDAGKTWSVDESLDKLATENHVYSYGVRAPGEIDLIGSGVLRDMVFDPLQRRTRFAVGDAGVFATFDGENWERLLSTRAMPGHPVAAYFDRISDPSNPMLYVAFNGRGIVRLGPLLAASPIKTPCSDFAPPAFPEEPPPLVFPLAIKSFTATPNLVGLGQTSTLKWSVSGPVKTLKLDGKVVAGTTSLVTPALTTTYTLVAESKCSEKMATASVTVAKLTELSATRVAPKKTLDVSVMNLPADAKIRLTNGVSVDVTPVFLSAGLRRITMPTTIPGGLVQVRAFSGAMVTNALGVELGRRADGAFKDVVGNVGFAMASCGSRTLTFVTIDASTKKAIFSDGSEATIHVGARSGATFSPGCTTRVIVDRPDASKPSEYKVFLSRFDGVGSSVPPGSIVDGAGYHILFSPDDSISILSGFSGILHVVAPHDMIRSSFFPTISFTSAFSAVSAEIVDGVTLKMNIDGTVTAPDISDP